MTSRNFTLLGALFGFLGVAFGAFGAHGLAAHFAANPDNEATFHTAVQYQMYHALALFAAAWLLERFPGGLARWAGVLFALGILLFSGSLYILSISEIRIMGAVAPLGGVAFLGGWLCLGITAWKASSSS
jgi:uncharacterized membrane protein YgdD (TMEM256/DUF423 family)